jgi:hypothetical protein
LRVEVCGLTVYLKYYNILVHGSGMYFYFPFL